MPKLKGKGQTADEGVVYGPADETYTVSDIPMLKQRIANNPASAGILQPLIDRLEAGDFDTPRTGPTEANEAEGNIDASIAAAMEAAGISPDFDFSNILTAADAEELFKNSLPIDYETLQKMGAADWMPAGVQTMIDDALGNIQNQNYIDQETLDAQLAGLPSAAEIQQYLETQGWGSIGDPFGTLSGLTPEQWEELLAGNYTTTNAVQQMIKDSLLQGLSEDDIFTMVQEQFGETMSDDEILQAIATAIEDQHTDLMAEVQKLIADSLASGMTEQEIIDLITTQYGDQMSPEDIQNAIVTAQQGIYDTMMAEVNALIAQALTDGLSPEQIAEMIRDQYGDQMTDDEILQAIADAQAGVPTIQDIEAMIADALANGMSPEAIATMISDYVGDSGLLSADDIATMIADAIAGIGTTTGGDALTSDAVQQMIDTAISGMPAGLSAEDVQAMLGESGYMGDTGVQGLIDAALQGSLGEGGSISQAIQAALAATGGTGTDIDTGMQQPSSPYGTYTSPYGDVDPYSLMFNPWYGTTPFAGGTTTGAESGVPGLDLGDPADYNFDISTEYDEDLFG